MNSIEDIDRWSVFSKSDVLANVVSVEVDVVSVEYWLEFVSVGECGAEGFFFMVVVTIVGLI